MGFRQGSKPHYGELMEIIISIIIFLIKIYIIFLVIMFIFWLITLFDESENTPITSDKKPIDWIPYDEDTENNEDTNNM